MKWIPLAPLVFLVASCGSTATDDNLQVRFLGVQGFLVQWNGEAVLTAPMYTNPSIDEVINAEVLSSPEAVHRYLGDVDLSDVRTVLSGHAHYDHILDVPALWGYTDDAMIYGNRTMMNLLAGSAPELDPACGRPAPDDPAWPLVPLDRLDAANRPDDFRVDTRLCPGQETCVGIREDHPGSWIPVPRTRVRLRPLCSSHPDQVVVIHYAGGCVEEPYCEPPRTASDYKEGTTLAFLIDLLDAPGGEPVFRIFYQDSPTSAPVGHVHADVLAEKRVDLALLCAGTFDQVEDQPGEILAGLNPRYALGGHWEDFFIPPSEPPVPQPLLDLDLFEERLEASCPADALCWVPMPGDEFELPAEE